MSPFPPSTADAFGHRPFRRPVQTSGAGSTGPAVACGHARPGGGAAVWSAACPAAG